MSKPRSIMIYADSGGTKTTQAYFLAKYLTTKYPGTHLRLIGSNASDSAPFEDSGMIEKGTVDFFDVSNRELALADMRRLAEGYWPRDAKNPKTGERITKGYFKKDSACMTKPEEWNKISGYIVEGLTGVSALLLNHMRQQEEGVGFKYAYKYEEDGYIIGGLDEGHYGIAQQELYKLFVQGFACLPIKFLIVTALVGRGEEKRVYSGRDGKTGRKQFMSVNPLYGPKGAGDAKTFETPSWFMDCFHLATETVEIKGQDNQVKAVEQRVAWFVKHNDKDTELPYLAKIRMLPEQYPEMVRRFPTGYVPLGFKNGLNKYYEALDEIVGQGTATTVSA